MYNKDYTKIQILIQFKQLLTYTYQTMLYIWKQVTAQIKINKTMSSYINIANKLIDHLNSFVMIIFNNYQQCTKYSKG